MAIDSNLTALGQIEFPRLYLALNHHKSTKGEPLDFSDKKYLLPIYRDNSQEIKIKKSVQMGISEWAICDAFAHCLNGRRVFYVFPTQDLRSKFVNDRLDKLKIWSPFYAKQLKEAAGGSDSRVMKHFGKGTLNFVGSNAESEMTAFPADCVTIEELDYCNFDNLPLAKDRLQAAPVKYYREISKPTIEGDGIDLSYRDSDQKVWQIKYPHCNDWQNLDFFVNIIRQVGDGRYEILDTKWQEGSSQDISVFCRKCGKSINRLSDGEHVPAYQHRISGYHLSHIISPTVSIAELWDDWQKAQSNPSLLQVFYNSRLGLAYTPEGAKLSLAILEKCIGTHANLSTSVRSVMGVDVGNYFHMVVDEPLESGLWKRVFIGKCRTKEELKEKIAQYNCEIVVADLRPEMRLMRELQVELGRKLWLCDYFTQPNSDAIVKDENDRTIKADRTQTMDASHEKYLLKKILLPANFRGVDNGDFVSQMCAPTRVYDEERKRFEWKEPSGVPDHYRHADNYCGIAKELLDMDRPIYRNFDRLKFIKVIKPIETLPLLVGWQLKMPQAVVFAQVEKGREGRIFVHSEFLIQENETLNAFADRVLMGLKEKFGQWNYLKWQDVKHYANPQGDSEDINIQAVIGIIASQTRIRPLKNYNWLLDSIPRIASKFNLVKDEPQIFIHPACEMLINGFAGGYHYQEFKESKVFENKPVENIYFSVQKAFEFAVNQEMGRVVHPDEEWDETPVRKAKHRSMTGYR